MRIPYFFDNAAALSVSKEGIDLMAKLSDGGLVGVIAVVAAILLIWLVVLSVRVFGGVSDKLSAQATSATEEKPETVAKPASVPSEDGVTVAVITAALAAYLSSQSGDGTYLPFRVVSFKRKKNGTPWNSDLK